MIEASGLRKSYRSRQGRKVTSVEAVRGVDFAVQRGEIFGFLGPNGAGKTTTLRMLATLLRPDGGEATIAEIDLRVGGAWRYVMIATGGSRSPSTASTGRSSPTSGWSAPRSTRRSPRRPR